VRVLGQSVRRAAEAGLCRRQVGYVDAERRQRDRFRVGVDKSLIIQGPNDRWYRATLQQPCASALPWKEHIAIEAQPDNQMDKFSNVIVDGNTCPLRTFEEIQNPQAAAEKPPA
jgi:hypothetical protein